MANEAYRAVFLRIHPTGKMVLSLTSESDGREGEYAQEVAAQLGVPALDVKVVPADTDRFGEGHGYNTSPSSGAQAAIARTTEKIRDKARLLAGMALDASPETVIWQDGAFMAGANGAEAGAKSGDAGANGGGAGANGGGAKTIADLALYAHGTGALPPGVEGGLDAQTVYLD